MILTKNKGEKQQCLLEHDKEVFGKLKRNFNLKINKINLINQCHKEENENFFQEEDLNV